MKTGRELPALAAEIQRQAASKKDYLADSGRIYLQEAGLMLRLGDLEPLGVTDLCHEQIAARLGIPQKYYERMRSEAPELLAENVNLWLGRRDERQLVRTLDGRARAFLSDRYRPLDHVDLAEAVLPALAGLGAEVMSAELTERRLYIQAVTPRIQAEVQKGDVVQAGLVVSNSEVGLGSVRVEPLVYRLVCLNGAIMPDAGVRKYHVGRSGADLDLDGAAEFYRDETRLADDRAFWLKVRDVVAATLDQLRFERIVDRLREAQGLKIERDPVKAVEEVSKRYGLTQDEQGGVLRYLIEGKDLSAYGLSNALTRTSQDVADYDRATELERLGGQVIELPRTDWQVLAGKN